VIKPPASPASTAEYKRAFARVRSRLTGNQRRMLEYHLRKARPVTSTELADHVSFQNWRGVSIQYGRIGAMLRKASPKLAKAPGQKSYAFARFDQPPRKDGRYSEYVWILHRNAETVFRAML
jgi:hypothetical protein